MTEKTGASASKKYTVADLYTEAAKMIGEEMSELKKRPLNPAEGEKVAELARVISRSVLKEMKVV